jgi:dTDP-4-dehydrorhamnose reductase (EC 1.1.1.133)
MKVLITGGGGQLGCDLEKELAGPGGHEVICLGRDRLDVTRAEQVREAVEAVRPEVVVHAAANTNVDRCELEPDGAYLVNALGTRNVAVAAARVKARLVYISTDYVFDGHKKEPYTEFDIPAPLSVYGKSKLAGEKYAAAFSDRFFIRAHLLAVRTGAAITSSKQCLSWPQRSRRLAVVDDQVGTPTFTEDLARCIGVLIQTELYGIYHASNSGACSWFDFARAIFRLAGLAHVSVKPIATAELNRPAPARPTPFWTTTACGCRGCRTCAPGKRRWQNFSGSTGRNCPFNRSANKIFNEYLTLNFPGIAGLHRQKTFSNAWIEGLFPEL